MYLTLSAEYVIVGVDLVTQIAGEISLSLRVVICRMLHAYLVYLLMLVLLPFL